LVVLTATACFEPLRHNETVTPGLDTFTSPLEEYLAVVWGTDLSFEDLNRRADERIARRIELITLCMHSHGFDFDIDNQPDGISVGFGTAIVQEGVLAPDDHDWVSRWGYGITNSPVINTRTVQSRDDRPFLSDAELDEFSIALTGSPARWWLQDEVYEDNCMALSSAQLDNEIAEGLAVAEQFAPLFDAIAAMEDSLRLEVSDADVAWSHCMADAGHIGFRRQWEARESIMTTYFSIGNRNTLDDELADQGELNLAEQEVALALADLECRIATDFIAQQNALRFELETRFVEDNRPFLEELRAAAEQRS